VNEAASAANRPAAITGIIFLDRPDHAGRSKGPHDSASPQVTRVDADDV